jgi:hypothetical protein
LCRAVSHQLNHICVWGPLMAVLIISINIKDVNRRVRCAARTTRDRRVCSC